MSSFNGAPGSPSSLREANSARIIETIKHYGQITQVELAAATNLSPATISNIVKQLVAQNIVRTDTTIRSGRRAQLVSMAVSNGLTIGIQIGQRHLALELADESHEVTAHHRLPLPANHRVDTTLDRAALLAMELTEEVGSSLDDVLAVGVCLPAPIDPATGRISGTTSLDLWSNTDVGAVLESRLKRTVVVENDANAGAVGESRFGELRGHEDAIFVHASRSVGVGLISGGSLHRGTRGLAGEIAHVQVDPTGLVCTCGARGCLETLVGIDALMSQLRLSSGVKSMTDLINAANSGNPGCRQLIADAATTIGSVLADLAVAFAPSRIVVSGDLVHTGELFLHPIHDAIARRPSVSRDLDLVPSSLDGRAEVLGALALARDAASDIPIRTHTSGGSR